MKAEKQGGKLGNDQESRCECHECTQARYRVSFQWQIDQALKSTSVTVTQPVLDAEEREPDKCVWCGGYHRGGCHREPSKTTLSPPAQPELGTNVQRVNASELFRVMNIIANMQLVDRGQDIPDISRVAAVMKQLALNAVNNALAMRKLFPTAEHTEPAQSGEPELCPTCHQSGPRNPTLWARLCPDDWHYPKPVPTVPARPEPTVDEALRFLSKLEKLTSSGAKLVYLKNFVAKVAESRLSSLTAQLEMTTLQRDQLMKAEQLRTMPPPQSSQAGESGLYGSSGWHEKLRDREWTGKIMHETWSKTKRVQGFHGPKDHCPYQPQPSSYYGSDCCHKFHADLIPWDDLPEAQKDINRHAFDAILAALPTSPLGWHEVAKGELPTFKTEVIVWMLGKKADDLLWVPRISLGHLERTDETGLVWVTSWGGQYQTGHIISHWRELPSKPDAALPPAPTKVKTDGAEQ